MMEGLRKPTELIVIVITLLSHGCPIQAMVAAFGLDERTVASWRDRAGRHCQHLHQAVVEQAKLDLVHVQADEIRVKGRGMVAWMGLAIMVSTRLWLAGAVSLSRDRSLADRLLAQVHRCAAGVRPLLILTDGWAAYPKSICRAFREKVKNQSGRGRACLQMWPPLQIGTVIKRTAKKRVVEVIRRMAQGTLEQAEALLAESRGGSMLNTAFIERLHATFRQRLATLTRRSRYAAHRLEALETGMYLIGSTYHFCVFHDELSSKKHAGLPTTPAMAAGLSDHRWSIKELLLWKLVPAPWHVPKRRGGPSKDSRGEHKRLSTRPAHLRPRLRLRKGGLHAVTG